jgi:hypothetical protein
MRRKILFPALIITLLALASCLSQPDLPQWTAADLRWLGEADASTPSTDILAVYTHTSALTVDVRVDLLDIRPGDPYRLRLSLWDTRAFHRDPFIIDLDSSGAVTTRGGGSGKPLIWPRVLQDHALDTVTFSMNRFLLGEHFTVDVTTYSPDSLAPLDEALSIPSDRQSPLQRAPVLLAFWNTFNVSTPAQALRRWDGAHTGPLGGRHGLRYLLDSSKKYHLPLVLLDLKNPASLAALSYLDRIGQVRSLADAGLLILPDVAYADPAETSLGLSRQAAGSFSLPFSRFVYDPTGSHSSNYAVRFFRLEDSTHLGLAEGSRMIPLPSAGAVQAQADGPSLDLRRALIRTALSPDPADLLTLGGSLPDSTWADVDMVGPTFAWLAAHPWITPLNENDLLAFPTGPATIPPPLHDSDPSPWLAQLNFAPHNAASQSARDTLLTLRTYTDDAQLSALRANYLPQVGRLLAAAQWAEAPTPQAACGLDLDGTGKKVCILSDEKTFAILDPAGARLTHLFILDESGIHQVVGPSSQFAVGLSDPSEWHLERGEAADPSVIPGAFADSADPWADYTIVTSLPAGNVIDLAGGMTFTSLDGTRSKTYRLTEVGIQIDYHLPGTEITRIPLALEPQAFFAGPVEYRPSLAPHTWQWIRLGGLKVEVHTDAHLSAQGFVSSFPFLSLPEDPNLDYPAGHYYPFPLSVVTIEGEGNFIVQIAVH